MEELELKQPQVTGYKAPMGRANSGLHRQAMEAQGWDPETEAEVDAGDERHADRTGRCCNGRRVD